MITIEKKLPRLNDVCQEEVVGLLGNKIGDDFLIGNYYRFENRSKDKFNSYYVGRNQYIKCNSYAKKKKLKFLGIIHTHIHRDHGKSPSEKDIKTARNNIINGVLYNNTLTLYNRNGIIEERKVQIKTIDYIIFNILRLLRI